jgi:DNA-binding IclR family transcriptional regulator
MPSVEKIARILEHLRLHYKTGLTNKEISTKLNIPPSTSYRILAAPIFGNEGRPVGAIALVGTSIDLDRAQLDEYAPLFVEAGSGIPGRIGAAFPEEILTYWQQRDKA